MIGRTGIKATKTGGIWYVVTSAVLSAVANGEITPADAGEISKLVETYVKAFETAELAECLERLERMTHQ